MNHNFSRLKKNIKNEKILNMTEVTTVNLETTYINNQQFPSVIGSSNQILTTDNLGVLSWTNNTDITTAELINDTSPQLSANLDLNSNEITGTGNISISGDITASNLNINGNTTHINTETISIEDPLIFLGKNNTGNTIDLGWYGKFVSSGTKYAGLIRDASAGKFKIFTTSTEPTTVVSNMTLSDLELNNLDCNSITSGTWNGSNLTQSQITDLTTDLTTLTNNISTNSTNIATNTSSISTNSNNISTNISNISTNSTNIATNTSSISTNSTNIATNTSSISTNSTNIATNSTNIATNTGKWSINGSELYRLSNVGIGTNNPTNLLDIRANNDSLIEAFKVRNNSSGSSSGVSQVITTSGSGDAFSRYYAGNHFSVGVDNSINSLKLVEGNGLDGIDGITIDTGGNVGIGTDNPNQKLSVAGNIELYGEKEIIFTKDTDGTNIAKIKSHIHGLIFEELRGSIKNKYMLGEGSHIWYCGANTEERVRLLSSGNFGIGTNNPSQKLDVNGNIQSKGLYLKDVTVDTGIDNGFYSFTNLDKNISFSRSTGYRSYYIGLFGDNSNNSNKLAFAVDGGGGDDPNIMGCFDSSGNLSVVGSLCVGTESSGYKLRVEGNGYLNGNLLITSLTSQGTVNLEDDIFLGSGNNERFRIHTRQSHSGDFMSIVPDNSTGGWEWSKGITLQRDGKVGIGDSSPSSKLDVNGNCRIIGNLTVHSSGEGIQLGNHEIKLTNSGVAHYSIVNDDSGILDFRNTSANEAFGTSGTSLMTITSAGNVGIGTTNPSNLLHLRANASHTYINIDVDNQTYYDCGIRFKLNDVDQWVIFSDNGNGNLYFNENSNDNRMIITAGGNVGIGTSNPNTKLHLHENSTSGVYLQLSNTTTGSGANDGFILMTSGGNVYLTNKENGGLVFSGNNTERMRIKNDGNVGIGTNDPQYKLDVYGNAFIGDVGERWRIGNLGYDDWAGLCHSNLSGSSYALLQHNSGVTLLNCASDKYISFRVNNSSKMIVSSNGNIGIGTNSPINKLHVYDGDVRCTDLYTSKFEITGWEIKTNHNTDIKINTARDLFFQTDNNTKMTLLNNGNVGIGLTNPSEKLEVDGNIKCSGVFIGESGSVVKIKILDFSNGADVNSSSWTDSQTLSYTKKVGTNLIITSAFDYKLNGYGGDQFESRLKVSDDATTYEEDFGRSVQQHFDGHGGGGSRSNSLNAIMVQTDSKFLNRTNVYITLQLRKSNADDYMNVYDGYFLVHEVIA